MPGNRSEGALVTENERLKRELEALRARLDLLQKGQKDLLALIENTDDFVLFSDREAKPVIFNRNYAAIMKEMLGIEMKPGFQPHTLLDEAGRAFWEEAHRRVLSGERFTLEFPFETEDATRHFEVSFNPVRDGEEVVGFSEFTREITERKTLMDELRVARKQSEADFQLLFEKMLDGYAMHEMIFDEDGAPIDYRFLAVNPAFEHLTGLKGEEILGRCAREVLPGLEEHWIESYGKVVTTGEPLRFESYASTLDRYYEVIAFRPRPGQFACAFQDITDRKRLELEQRRAERLESVGLLAGGIAHDFNNILGVLLTTLQLTRRRLETGGTEDRLLAESEKACERASDLTQQLLTFARGGAPIRQPAQIGAKLEQWVHFALHGSNCGADLEIAEDLWPVEVDLGQLSQVIHNLVFNADQAMPDGGTITIRAENRIVEQQIRIQVTDQGPGIASADLAKVFDPYFTTKQSGSGLGLATCYSVIRAHQGEIAVASAGPDGACFEILLPALPPDTRLPEPTATIAELPTGSGRVLFMDDEPVLLKMAGTALRSAGFEVLLASGGEEAVEHYRKALGEARPIEAVILDLTISGGLGGLETLHQLQALDPMVRAIVTSGYSQDGVLATHREHGFRAALAKPFRIERLLATLTEVLEAED